MKFDNLVENASICIIFSAIASAVVLIYTCMSKHTPWGITRSKNNNNNSTLTEVSGYGNVTFYKIIYVYYTPQNTVLFKHNTYYTSGFCNY